MASLPGIFRAAAFLLVACGMLAAEPIRFSSAEATFHRGDEAEFLKVIDGVEFGPEGWSPAPRTREPHALVVRCARPVEAAELDVTLFFLAGRPWNPMAEFSLSFTTEPEPSLQGNWQPLEITRIAAEVSTLRRVPGGRLRMDFTELSATGNDPDEVFRLSAKLPGGRATGFRLDAFPVPIPGTGVTGLSWWSPYDFTLTEFRVAPHARETTNIALHQPVRTSHPLFSNRYTGELQKTSNLTDGSPATVAHPQDPALGAAFHFEIDLGRVAGLDHISLRNRGDYDFDRLSRLRVRLYEKDPASGAAPVWEGMDRADGSHPAPAAVDILRPGIGKGKFSARYLRLSSDSPAPLAGIRSTGRPGWSPHRRPGEARRTGAYCFW
jgi:hypothetical protein